MLALFDVPLRAEQKEWDSKVPVTRTNPSSATDWLYGLTSPGLSLPMRATGRSDDSAVVTWDCGEESVWPAHDKRSTNVVPFSEGRCERSFSSFSDWACATSCFHSSREGVRRHSHSQPIFLMTLKGH